MWCLTSTFLFQITSKLCSFEHHSSIHFVNVICWGILPNIFYINFQIFIHHFKLDAICEIIWEIMDERRKWKQTIKSASIAFVILSVGFKNCNCYNSYCQCTLNRNNETSLAWETKETEINIKNILGFWHGRNKVLFRLRPSWKQKWNILGNL